MSLQWSDLIFGDIVFTTQPCFVMHEFKGIHNRKASFTRLVSDYKPAEIIGATFQVPIELNPNWLREHNFVKATMLSSDVVI